MVRRMKHIINHVCTKLVLLWTNRHYGYFGKGSKMIKPMRIVNKAHIYIGNECIFLHSARLEAIRHNKGQGCLRIGDNTSFQQHCHIIAADNLSIGKNCVFSAYVYVADCSHPYDPNVDIATGELKISRTKIGNHCFVGIGACIMPGVTIGDYSVVGANAVVTRDVPPYSMVAGVPARIIRKYDLENKCWEKY